MILFFIFAIGQQTFAAGTRSEWRPQLYIQNQNEISPLQWPIQYKSKWTKNEEGVLVFHWLVTIETDWNLDNQVIQLKPVEIKYKVNNNKIIIKTQFLTSQIKIGNHENIIIKFSGVPPMNIDENCKASRIDVISQPEKFPFFVGLNCQTNKSGVQVHLSFPQEVELVSSSIFETLGKGEIYRTYDLTPVQLSQAKIGDFEFSFKDQKYHMSLNSIQDKAISKNNSNSASENQLTSAFRVQIGSANLSLKMGDVYYKTQNPALQLDLLPKKIWKNMIAGLEAELTVKSNNKANSNASSSSSTDSTATDNNLSYMSLRNYFGYSFEFSNNKLFLQPRTYFDISSQKSGSGVNVDTTQIGLGILFGFNIGSKNFIQFNYMTEALSSPVIQKHRLVELQYIRKSPDSHWGWGFTAQVQSFLVLDPFLNIRQLDQSILLIHLQF